MSLSTAVLPVASPHPATARRHRHDQRRNDGKGSLIVVLGAVEAAAIFARRWLQSVTALHVEGRLRARLFARLQQADLEFIDDWKPGQLLSRATDDVAMIRRFLAFSVVFTAVNIANYLAVLGTLLWLYWPLGLVAAASGLPVFLVSRRFSRLYHQQLRRRQIPQSTLAGLSEESADGLRTIKSFGQQLGMSALYARQAAALHDSAVAKTSTVAHHFPMANLVSGLTLAVVTVAGSIAVAHGRISVGTLISVILLHAIVVWLSDSLGWIAANAEEATNAADRVTEVLDHRPTILDRATAVALPDCTGRLRFDSVRFSYPTRSEPVSPGSTWNWSQARNSPSSAGPDAENPRC
jgi:ATP-binding cassette, subfamily B, bacterial